MARKMVTIDGNTAAGTVAHATNEVIAIYPITPSSTMGELADELSAEGQKNIWGTVPTVVEMQSEAGAAGAVHGALTTGALTTTFTASQGLLLMIPNMYKIAGELTSTVFHIAARALATHALSIFGDHEDVMACRSTGWAMLCANNAQEIMDCALIAQAATLESRVPFLHFFDGFRSYLEVQKIEQLTHDDMRAMVTDDLVAAHRARALNPEKPTIKGTAQNPDVYFAGREAVNKFYEAVPEIVQKAMDKFAKLVGRQYRLFDYVGAPDAERVIIMMGNGAETAEEAAEYLIAKGEKVGVLKVRLFRPFSLAHFAGALPKTVKAIAVLDRTKEPGALGEPLYQDVCTAIGEATADGTLKLKQTPAIVGGRYGLGSYEFTGAMAKSVFDNLKEKTPKNHFTVGINDDVMHTSLPFDPTFSSEPAGVHRAMFYGLGADGTIGANKNSIKIIGKATDNYVQGYFVLDSKKSGSITISHLRFGKKPIKSTYLISKASFLACHKFSFLQKYDMLSQADDGAVFLLNSPFGKDEVWSKIPVEVQKQIIDKKLRFYVIDGTRIADEVGLRGRINVTMQTAFFLISGVLPEAKALELIRTAIEDTYGNKGKDVVAMNMKAVETARSRIEQVAYPAKADGTVHMLPPVPAEAPEFVRTVTAEIIAGRGELLPVSKFPVDGTWPTATTRWEKRNIAEEIPVWDSETCIQCGECSMVCPHAVIRMKIYDPALLGSAPASFKSVDARGKEFEGKKFTLQVSSLDCTGCGICVSACPSFKKVNGEKTDKKAINMAPQLPLQQQEAKNFEFFLSLPEVDPKLFKRNTIKGSQLIQPLFEFSGACAGCGETPYVKLMSQLYGDRAIIANATGCTSIYGGNLPTTPYAQRKDGRGPSWSNSLFEDAAEFGFGMRLTSDKLFEFANELIDSLIASGKSVVSKDLLAQIRTGDQSTQEGIETQRGRVAEMKKALAKASMDEEKRLLAAADYLIKKSVWILGGDGWAYDIGYGGLDHVIASGRKVNILALDTGVYSNTGGQASKATPVGAVAKFAAGGKSNTQKDLGMMAMSYGSVYVARVAFGANRLQTIRAFSEADEYNGPALIIAYSHCINHGYDLRKGLGQQKLAVESGAWPLFRYNPKLKAEGKNPLILDSKEPTVDIGEYMYNEIRFRALKQAGPERAAELLDVARRDAKERYAFYKYLADRPYRRRSLREGGPRAAADGGPKGRSGESPGEVILERWQTLAARPVPGWYDDAKLGIMIHWGPYAVPAWAPPTGELPKVVAEKGWEYWFSHNSYAEWYENSMLIPGSPTHDRHRVKWGRMARYDAFARTFRQGVKEWDPARWVDAALASAARYVIFTAKHHDGFLLWPARRRNPRKGGWQLTRDVVGELAEASRAHGLRFGLYYSGGLDWTFGGAPIRSLADLRSATPRSKGYASYVDSHWRELITRYAPSILWNDVGSPPGEDVAGLFTDYYAAVPDGVVNDRFGQAAVGVPGSLPHRLLTLLGRLIPRRAARQTSAGLAAPAARHADFKTREYEITPEEGDAKWESVRGLGCSFACVDEQEEDLMLSAAALVRLLVDVVAGGGNLLLGVGPAADGTIPQAQLSRLQGLGHWLKLNGEAIFGSRPWGKEREDVTEDDVPIRYTCRGMTTYAILNGTPAGRSIVLPSIRLLPYAGVRILGSLAYVTWYQEGKDVHIRLSEPLRESPAHVISITPQPRA